MKQQHLLPGLWLAGSVSLVFAQPVWAQVVQITGVRLEPTSSGLEIILETAGGTPQIVTSSEGNAFVADLTGVQLRLSEGDAFRDSNPVEGVESVTVTPLDGNRVRVRVVGEAGVPSAEAIPTESARRLSLTLPSAQVPESETEPIEELELVVTATRRETEVREVPRSITVITREQIEEQTNFTRDLGDILGQLVPGLAPPTGSISSFGQSLRGRNLAVLIDGVPQSTSRSAFRDLRTIDPAAIERIEVLRGPTAIYGDGATGGVINIITRQAEAERLSATTTVGVDAALGELEGDSFGANLQQTLSINEGNLDFTGSFSIVSTGSFFDAQGDRIPPDPNRQGGYADAETLNLFGKLGIDIGQEQRLEFSVNYFDDRQETDFTTDPIVDQLPGRQKARALEGLELDEPQESENTVLNLSYRHEDLLGSQVDAQVYYRDYFTRFLPFDGRRFPSLANSVIQSWVESEKWGGRLGIETPLSSGGTVNLLWGLDYVNEDTAQPVSIIDPIAFEASNGLVFREIGDRTWTPPVELSSLGIFAQLNWEISDRVTVNGGLRHERAGIEIDDFTTLSGNDVIGGELDFDATLFNIGAVFDATDEISVFANFSQGFSVADVGRVLRDVPSGQSIEAIEPEPQQVDNYEIGIRGSWRNLQASLSGFYNESDLGTTFAADFSTVRAPERIYGLEATLDTQPGDNWRFGGTFSWTEGEVDTDNDDDFDPLDGFRIPPVKITAYVENETLPGWRNRLQALFSGSRDRFEDSTAFGRREVESYFVVDFVSSINVGAGRLELGVENLFDNQYFPIVSQLQSSDSLYAAARGRTLSLRYSIDW